MNAWKSPRQAATGSALRAGRRWRRALVPLAAAAAVIAVVVTVVGSSRGPSQYRVARIVTFEPAYLDCRTESVCYAWFTQVAHSGLAKSSERTFDGGAAWQKLASPPDREVLNDSIEPSCPTANMCVAVTERDTLALTTDSGASWRLDPLPPAARSAGWIDQVSCATVRECVVHISGGLTRGAFLSTSNGGRSWTAATQVPGGAPGSLQLLHCDPSGQCIGAVSAGLGTAYVPGHGPGLKIMRSADDGLTWSVVTLLSCPSPGGCVGLASTLSQEKSAFLQSGGFASGIVQTPRRC
jgi:photosystem II stability/assembly factor-like uncharacterized protein